MDRFTTSIMQISLVIQLDHAEIANENKTVLHDVNFALAEGEMSYLIGKSGSGKSSLLKTLYGAQPLKSGKGSVGTYDLNTLDKHSIPLLRRTLGMVFQDFHLFDNWTVRQNLEYILKATDWKDKDKITLRAQEVIDEVKLGHKMEEKVYNLSGGEQQRVVIARAILNHPKIILADEPTGNLDPETSDDIFRLLYKVATENKSAMLIATHDHRIIEKFPARVYKCVDGALREL